MARPLWGSVSLKCNEAMEQACQGALAGSRCCLRALSSKQGPQPLGPSWCRVLPARRYNCFLFHLCSNQEHWPELAGQGVGGGALVEPQRTTAWWCGLDKMPPTRPGLSFPICMRQVAAWEALPPSKHPH